MISDKLQTIFLIIFFILVVLGFLWKFYPGTFYFSDNSKANNSQFVTFDTAKYINAKREMTARLLGTSEQQTEVINILAGVEKNTMEVIKKHSKNRVVLVKQALVLEGLVIDITDQVLVDLGLPVSIKSIQPQMPDKINSVFSNSDDYLHGQKINKQIQERVLELNNQAEEEHKLLNENLKKQEIEQFLP